MSDNFPDLTASSLSTAREKVLEHRLLSDLAILMLQRGSALDILRSEFDALGHDVVLEATGMMRHVQLKATRDGGKRRNVDINVRLRAKPSGCVVWMTYDPVSLAITGLRWFGGAPGEPLPDLGNAVTRHSKGTGLGVKNRRPALRNVGIGRFERLGGLDDLADHLFGAPHGEPTAMVVAQLRQQFGEAWRAALSAELRGCTFELSSDWAHRIDGYALLEQLMELDAPAWLEERSARSRAGAFCDDPGLLWTQLFLEHRRWRFASPHEPPEGERQHLDELASKTAKAIRKQILTPPG